MKWYGSFQNRLIEGAKSVNPEIGMGATELCWSDRHAWMIISVKDSRHITVQRMSAKRKCYQGDYEITPNDKGMTVELFLTKKGQWRERYGRKLGNVFFVGYAKEYMDPCF